MKLLKMIDNKTNSSNKSGNMMMAIQILTVFFLASCSTSKQAKNINNEPHRPQLHFSPKKGWMNDPNGMVYYNNIYHLFYQYYPDSTVWGPMHWGHAISKDLVHWKELPIALYPDSLGYIFSGSAVADVNNTSGFGKDGKIPLVAIFTHHDMKGEKSGINTYENQSIAYSLDEGKTWTKYAGNPVLKNPGIKDFRDPKVSWYEDDKKWIMTLATLDHITFYSSPNLKEWTKESEIGKNFGAHGGVWECPDLLPLQYNGQLVWVLIVNINPGGPNGGSATQYFTGQFDGHTFTPYQKDTQWLDFGPDEYAGITYSGTSDRKIFIGWMSNWQYANVTPTKKWRSATTIPRELGLTKVGEKLIVTSQPLSNLDAVAKRSIKLQHINATNYNLTEKTGKLTGPARIHFTADELKDFSITLSNTLGEKLLLGYDETSNQFYIDRTNSGKVNFEKGFAAKHTAPRFATTKNVDMTLIIDNASIELFADNGLTVMTEIFFPNENYSYIQFTSTSHFTITSLEYTKLKGYRK